MKFESSFFFQAEDGIRDGHVTGVQTCALPILLRGCAGTSPAWTSLRRGGRRVRDGWGTPPGCVPRIPVGWRSEERRVGKECRSLEGLQQYTQRYLHDAVV